jgi:hypothetical protein
MAAGAAQKEQASSGGIGRVLIICQGAQAQHKHLAAGMYICTLGSALSNC